MTRPIRLGTESTAKRMISCGILSHARTSDLFRASKLVWDLAQALAYKILHKQKSTGLRSGLNGGHSSFDMKSGISCFSHSCVVRAVWAGAPSCWKVQRSSSDKFLPHFFKTGFKIRSWYDIALIFTPEGTKINLVRWFLDTPAQTMTEAGWWFLSVIQRCSGMSDELVDSIRSF